MNEWWGIMLTFLELRFLTVFSPGFDSWRTVADVRFKKKKKKRWFHFVTNFLLSKNKNLRLDDLNIMHYFNSFPKGIFGFCGTGQRAHEQVQRAPCPFGKIPSENTGYQLKLVNSCVQCMCMCQALTAMSLCMCICWPLPSNQSFIGKLPATREVWVIIG